tara:strand:+ start:330 stop:518 length:189 start_codon:yes stop_codon:yes gene_type:complete
MGYEMITGFTNIYGLYDAIFPQIIYALKGSSCQLSVNSQAMDSHLVATALNTLAIVDVNHSI